MSRSILLLGIILFLPTAAHGGLSLTLEGSPGSSIINVAAAGTTTYTFVFPIGLGSVSMNTTSVDIFAPMVNGNIPFISGGIDVVNLTAPDAVVFNEFGFVEVLIETIDISIVAGTGSLAASNGDTIGWSGTGTFDMAGGPGSTGDETFDDLKQGTFLVQDSGFLSDPILLTIRAVAVPEPATGWMVIGGLIACSRAGRRAARCAIRGTSPGSK